VSGEAIVLHIIAGEFELAALPVEPRQGRIDDLRL
jgi:hypothetical protein